MYTFFWRTLYIYIFYVECKKTKFISAGTGVIEILSKSFRHTWATYLEITTSWNYRTQPCWSLHTYCRKWWCRSTKTFIMASSITCAILRNHTTDSTLYTLEALLLVHNFKYPASGDNKNNNNDDDNKNNMCITFKDVLVSGISKCCW